MCLHRACRKRRNARRWRGCVCAGAREREKGREDIIRSLCIGGCRRARAGRVAIWVQTRCNVADEVVAVLEGLRVYGD